jgi:hypothetical protein
MPRPIGFVLRSFNVTVAQAIGLVDPVGDLLLHGQRQLDGLRRDGINDELVDGGVYRVTADTLASRVAVGPAGCRSSEFIS